MFYTINDGGLWDNIDDNEQEIDPLITIREKLQVTFKLLQVTDTEMLDLISNRGDNYQQKEICA